MRPKTLLVLALVVAGLGVWIWFVERDLPTSTERSRRAKQLVDLDPDRVSELLVSSPAGESRLVRDLGTGDDASPGSWRLAEPMEARADAAVVDALLGAVLGLEKKRTLDDGGDPSIYGLQPPRVTVTIVAVDETIVIELGEEVPGTTDRMAKVGGAVPLHVVEGSVLDRLSSEPGDWRSRDLFVASRGDVERIEVGAASAIVLERRARNRYWVTNPFEDPADTTAVDALLGSLVGLRADEFVDDLDPSVVGLDVPAAEVAVHLAGGSEPWTVEIGSELPSDESASGEEVPPASARRYVRVGEQIAISGGSLLETVARTAEGWRSPKLSQMSSWEIDELVLRDGGGELRLARDDAEWRRNGEKIEYDPANALVVAVSQLVGEPELATKAPIGAAIELELSSADTTERIAVMPTDDGPPVAVVEGRSAELVLAGGRWEEIVVAVAAVRGAALLDATEATDETEEAGAQ